MFAFNPTIVQFKRVWHCIVKDNQRSFNPTIVRFKRRYESNSDNDIDNIQVNNNNKEVVV